MATVSPYVRFTVTLAGRRWLCYTLALAACSADRPPCSCSVFQVVSQTRAKCRHPAGGGRLPAGKCSEPHHERLTLHAAWLHSTDTPQSLAVQHRGRRPGPTGCSHRGPLDVGAERPSPQHADFRGHGVSSTGTRSAYRSPSACRRTGSCPRVSSPTDYTACPDLRASLSSRCVPVRLRDCAYATNGLCSSVPSVVTHTPPHRCAAETEPTESDTQRGIQGAADADRRVCLGGTTGGTGDAERRPASQR